MSFRRDAYDQAENHLLAASACLITAAAALEGEALASDQHTHSLIDRLHELADQVSRLGLDLSAARPKAAKVVTLIPGLRDYMRTEEHARFVADLNGTTYFEKRSLPLAMALPCFDDFAMETAAIEAMLETSA